jgi:cell wall-associated NlpC family hydrolase
MAKKFQIVTRSAPLTLEASEGAELASELLYGEIVETLAHRGDYLHARNLTDGYEGFVPKSMLSDEIIAPTHHIKALHSFIYSEPDYKSPSLTYLSFLSQLTLTGESEDGFAEIEGGGWIWQGHLEALDNLEQSAASSRADIIADCAERFLGIPYLWGGKTSRGLDCSGLVQLCAAYAGIVACPRDSKDQARCKDLGQRLEMDDVQGVAAENSLQRGDIVFFKGHVGIMRDNIHIVNATARTMDVRIETLTAMAQHYEGGILSVRRL